MGMFIVIALYLFVVSVDSRPAGGCHLTLKNVIIWDVHPFPDKDSCFWEMDPSNCVTPPGTELHMRCVNGFVPDRGAYSTECSLVDQQPRWTKTLLTCRKMGPLCPSPTELLGGEIKGNCSTCEVGHELTFSCGDNLDLIGKKTTTCLSTQKWKNPFPHCRRSIRCPDPDNLPNTNRADNKKFQLEGFGPGDRVSYECHKGFLYEDFFWVKYQNRTCSNEGKWEGDFYGNCKAVTCYPPESPNNGKYTPYKESYDYQDNVFFHCEENFELNGSGMLTCTETGTWSPYEPECHAITCPDPSQPGHGRRIGSSFAVGDTVSFVCYGGLTLRGSENRTCLSTTQWSGQLAVCVKGDSDCPDLGTPIGGTKYGDSYNVGDTVEFECNNDFWLEGSARRVCLKQGIWSGTETNCRYKRSYTDPEEAGLAFSKKLDTLALDTSASLIGSQLRGNLSLDFYIEDLENITSRGRALDLEYKFGLDIYLLIDVSGSINDTALETAKEFCKAIIKKVGVSPRIDGTRIVILKFAGTVKEVVTLQDTQTPEAVIEKIEGLTRIDDSKSTATNAALDEAKFLIETQALGKNKAKAKAKSAIILLTDGRHNVHGNPFETAAYLKEKFHVDIYCIGIGSGVKGETLSKIAKPGQYFRLKDVNSLGVINSILNTTIDYSECGVGGLANLPEDFNEKSFVDVEDIKTWPWMAGLYYDTGKDGKYRKFKCGASLIRPQWLLTAAHCFRDSTKPEHWAARMGYEKISVSRQSGIPLTVQKVIPHPDFSDDANPVNDIALVKLLEPTSTTDKMRTVCLTDVLDQYQVSEEEKDLYRTNRYSDVTGWGDKRKHSEDWDTIITNTDNLKLMSLPIKSNDTCINSISDGKYIYDDNMFCAGDGKDKDTCTGDSGGPSMVKVNVGDGTIRVFQIGVVSWGVGCRQEGHYGFYTRVDKFMPWITATLEDEDFY